MASSEAEARPLHRVNAVLPYSTKLQAEADGLIALLLNEVSFAGSQYETKSVADFARLLPHLRKFHTVAALRYRIQPAEWSTLVTTLYLLNFSDGADLRTQTAIQGALNFLLKDKQPTSSIQLDWKPLWHLLQGLYLTDENPKSIASQEILRVHATSLCILIDRASRYFTRQAVAAIVATFAPQLANTQSQVCFSAQVCLRLFLPSWTTVDELPVGTLEEWMRIWAGIDRCPTWDFVWAGIFARLAHPDRLRDGGSVGVGDGGFVWGAYFPFWCHRLLGALEVPVGGHRAKTREYGGDGAGLLSLHKKPSMGSIVKLLTRLMTVTVPPRIASVYGDHEESSGGVSSGGESSVSGVGDASCMGHLERLLRTLTTQFYPTSPSAGYFASVLRVIITAFIRRYARETSNRQASTIIQALATNSGATTTPTSTSSTPGVGATPLPQSLLVRFVAATLPLATLGLYLPRASNGSWAVEVGKSLRNLAILAPKKICGELVNMAGLALDPSSVNQTHTAPNALEVLGDSLASLLYPMPHIMAQLPGLLTLALPGIDANDDKKTLTTIHFFTNVLRSVPLVDSDDYDADVTARTRSDRGVDVDAVLLPSWHPGSAAYALGPRVGARGPADEGVGDLSSEDAESETRELFLAAREAHAQMADWSLLLLDRVFKVLETREKAPSSKVRRSGGGSASQRTSESVAHGITTLAERLFQQMSPALLKAAASRVLAWVSSVSCLDGDKTVAHLLASLVSASPHTLLPRLSAPHLEAIEGSKASPALLRWHLTCLYGLTKHAGSAVLSHVPGLTAAIQVGFASEEKPSRKAAGKLVRALLHNLLCASVAPLGASHSAADMASPSTLWLKLGAPYTLATPPPDLSPFVPSSVAIHWSLPTHDMKVAAVDLVNLFVVGTMARLHASLDKLTAPATAATTAPATAATTMAATTATAEVGEGGGGKGGLFSTSLKEAERFRADIELLSAVTRGVVYAIPDTVGEEGDDAIIAAGTAGQCIAWDANTHAAVLVAGGVPPAPTLLSLRHVLLCFAAQLGECVQTHVDLCRDTKALASIIKLTQRLCTGRGPRKSKISSAIASEAQGEREDAELFRFLIARRLVKRIHEAYPARSKESLGAFRYATSLDAIVTQVMLQYLLRKGESLFSIPRALHYGMSSPGSCLGAGADAGGEAADDDEGEGEGEADVSTSPTAAAQGGGCDSCLPLTTLFPHALPALRARATAGLGEGVWRRSKAAEHPYIFCLSMLAALSCHSYDVVRGKALSNLGGVIAMFPWFKPLLHRTALGKLEVMVDAAALQPGTPSLAAAPTPQAPMAPLALDPTAAAALAAEFATRSGMPPPSAEQLAALLPSLLAAASSDPQLAARLASVTGGGARGNGANSGASVNAGVNGGSSGGDGITHYAVMGNLMLSTLSKRLIASDIPFINRLLSITLKSAGLLRKIAIDKQSQVTQILLSPAAMLYMTWYTKLPSARDPEVVKAGGERRALMMDMFHLAHPSAPLGDAPTGPVAARGGAPPPPQGQFADASKGDTMAPYTGAHLHWKFELVACNAACMLLAPPILPPLSTAGDVAPPPAYSSDYSFECPEQIWLWACSTAVADNMHLRDCGFHMLMLLLQGSLARRALGKVDSPLPRVVALLSNDRFISQLVMAVSNSHATPNESDQHRGRRAPTEPPRNPLSASRSSLSHDGIVTYTHIAFFESLLMYSPTVFDPIMKALTSLVSAAKLDQLLNVEVAAAEAEANGGNNKQQTDGDATASATAGGDAMDLDTSSSGGGAALLPAHTPLAGASSVAPMGSMEAHDLASLRMRQATVAEAFAGLVKVISLTDRGDALSPAAWTHADCDPPATSSTSSSSGGASRSRMAQLLALVAPILDKLPTAWRSDWGNALRLAAQYRNAQQLSSLVRYVFANAQSALLAGGGVPATALTSQQHDTLKGLFTGISPLAVEVAPPSALIEEGGGGGGDAAIHARSVSFASVSRWLYLAGCLLEELCIAAGEGEASMTVPGVTNAAHMAQYCAVGGIPQSPTPPHTSTTTTSPRQLAMSLALKLLPTVLSRLGHPFKSCRDAVAAFIGLFFEFSRAPDAIASGTTSAAADAAAAAIQLQAAVALEVVVRTHGEGGGATSGETSTPAAASMTTGAGTGTESGVPPDVRTWCEHVLETACMYVYVSTDADNATMAPRIIPFIPVLLGTQGTSKKELSGLAAIVTHTIAQNMDLSYSVVHAPSPGVQAVNAFDELRAMLTTACDATLTTTVSAASGSGEAGTSSTGKGGDDEDGGGGVAGGATLGWSIRRAAVSFLVPIRARNVMCISHSQDVGMLQFVEVRLKDKQVEVQEAACNALIGFVATLPAAGQVVLARKYLEMAATKLPRKIPAPLSFATASAKEIGDYRDYKRRLTKLVRKRHAGVLGAASVIQAHPFDVPPFLPSVLSTLAKHVADPQPIASTVRRVFTEFKSTHQDNWESHKQMFTADELVELVELLVSPHYYA